MEVVGASTYRGVRALRAQRLKPRPISATEAKTQPIGALRKFELIITPIPRRAQQPPTAKAIMAKVVKHPPFGSGVVEAVLSGKRIAYGHSQPCVDAVNGRNQNQVPRMAVITQPMMTPAEKLLKTPPATRATAMPMRTAPSKHSPRL